MKTKFFLIFCLVVYTIVLHAQNNYQWRKSIPYRTENKNAYMEQKCLLDLYYPTDKKEFPTVIWFHGGGLTAGNREIPLELQEKGVAVVGVSYRLCPGNKDLKVVNADVTTDDAVDDAAAAAAWVLKNISQYGGDPSKVYLAGHSAGGYLVSMIGFDKKRLEKYGVDADRFAALIPFSGQAITHFQNRRDRGISDYQPLVDEYAPLYYIRNNCPPVILICGDREREMLGRYEENAYMWRMLRIMGHPAVFLYELEGFDHGSMVHPAFHILLEYIRNREK